MACSEARHGIPASLQGKELDVLADNLRMSAIEHQCTVCVEFSKLALKLFYYSDLIRQKAIDPLIPIQDYWAGTITLRGDFAKRLKKVRQAAYIATLSNQKTKDNYRFFEEVNEFNLCTIEPEGSYHYDSFLHEKFLPKWEETTDDFGWAFKPVEVNARTLDSFRDAAYNLLSRHKVKRNDFAPTDEDRATWISDSITREDDLISTSNRGLMRKYAVEGKFPEPAVMPRFVRSIVHVDPANVRDTWQCTADTLFLVKEISYRLRPVVGALPSSLMCSYESAIKRQKRLKQEFRYYMMFDYKKCGLTVNRELLVIIGEVLNEIYPNSGFDLLTRWKTIEVFDEVWRRPPRGVGLGNCNEGITLIQCVLGEMVSSIYPDTECAFFNDDGAFSFESISGSARKFTSILSLMRSIGMIVNLKKTLLSDNAVFCEEYYINESKALREIDYRKYQLTFVQLAECFYQQNTAVAKSLFHAMTRGNKGLDIDTSAMASDLADAYPYEFSRLEIYWPFEFGGWIHFGRSTMTEFIRFAFQPEDYLEEGEPRSTIPFVRRWINYLIETGLLGVLNQRKFKIKYSEYVPNPFIKDRAILPLHGLAKMGNIGLATYEEDVAQYDDLYNYRGSKNAKPVLRRGIYDKFAKTRAFIRKRFRMIDWKPLVNHPGAVLKTVIKARRGLLIPSGIIPPDSLGEGWSEPISGRRRGQVIMPPHPPGGVRPPSKKSLERVFTAIVTGSRCTDPHVFSVRNESPYLNRKPVVLDGCFEQQWERDYPPYAYLFFSRPERANTILAATIGKVARYWSDVNVGPESEEILKCFFPLRTLWDVPLKIERAIVADSRRMTLFEEILGEDSDFTQGGVKLLAEIVAEHEFADESPETTGTRYFWEEDDQLLDELANPYAVDDLLVMAEEESDLWETDSCDSLGFKEPWGGSDEDFDFDDLRRKDVLGLNEKHPDRYDYI